MKKILINRSNIQKSFDIVWVLIIILFCKTVFFGIVYRQIFQYIFYAIALFGLILYRVDRNRLKTNFFSVLPFIFLIICNIAINFSDLNNNDLNQEIGTLLVFVMSAIICSYISIEKFSFYYIKIMFIIAIISLICVSIANFNEDIAYSLCQPGYTTSDTYGYSFFYMWGWAGLIFSRNSGPFWEPGAFQGFLILALIMLLFDLDNKKNSNRKMYLIVFVITILTTQSTTGYLLLIFLLGMKWTKVNKVFVNTNIFIRSVIVVFIVLGSFLVIFKSNNITEKIQGTNNESAEVRFGDLINGPKAIIEGGLFGLGETENKGFILEKYDISKSESAGLWSMGYTYGILILFYYIFLLIKCVNNIFIKSKAKDKIIFIVVYITLQLTEGIYFFPVYLFFLFGHSIQKRGLLKNE